jgi:hypothetical protein
MNAETPNHDDPRTLAAALAEHLPALKDVVSEKDTELPAKTAEALGVMVGLLGRMTDALLGELEFMGKTNPRIKAMQETVADQKLLDFEAAISKVLSPNTQRITRLSNTADLMVRWWSAVAAGVHTAILDIPDAVARELNPSDWPVEKKRWSSEEAAYWEHFKFVIREELPLKLGDHAKRTHGDKTLEAYTILGSSGSTDRPADT